MIHDVLDTLQARQKATSIRGIKNQKILIVPQGEDGFQVERDGFGFFQFLKEWPKILALAPLLAGLFCLARLEKPERGSEIEIKKRIERIVKRELVDSYPMTGSGKVQKFILCERAIKALGLEEAAQIRTA